MVDPKDIERVLILTKKTPQEYIDKLEKKIKEFQEIIKYLKESRNTKE